MVVVRPWKLFSQTMISAWSCGMPLRVYPQRRTALMAVSTASAPVFIGSTISMPQSCASSATKRGNWSLRKAREVSVTRAACSCKRLEDARMAVALVQRRVGAQAIQVALAVDVVDPDAGRRAR